MPTAEKTTRELVEEQFEKGVTEATEIAEKIGKERATVYVHLRKIREERGIPSRGRGRPPRVEGSGNKNGKAEKTEKVEKTETPRKAPPKAGKTKATEPAKVTMETQTNGHTPEFPQVEAAIRNELKDARRRVQMLEAMLKPFES